MLSISIADKWPKQKGARSGRRVNSKFWYSVKRKERQENQSILFIDETYLGYNKDNYGLWNLRLNSWNERRVNG